MTNKLKIKFDKNNNPVYVENPTGVSEVREYDANNRIIKSTFSNGFWFCVEYDENCGQVTHYKNSKGAEYWSEYDANGNEILFKNGQNTTIHEYDKNNRLIHSKSSNGIEYWNKYDEDGKLISSIDWNNNPITTSNTMDIVENDDRGNVIYRKNSNGYEEWFKYDDNNNLIYYKNSQDREEWITYDDRNNRTSIKTSRGTETNYINIYE